MQIKAALRPGSPQAEGANVTKGQGRRTSVLYCESANLCVPRGNQCGVPQTTENRIPVQPLRHSCVYTQKPLGQRTLEFLAHVSSSVFPITRNWSQPGCPPTEERSMDTQGNVFQQFVRMCDICRKKNTTECCC